MITVITLIVCVFIVVIGSVSHIIRLKKQSSNNGKSIYSDALDGIIKYTTVAAFIFIAVSFYLAANQSKLIENQIFASISLLDVS